MSIMKIPIITKLELVLNPLNKTFCKVILYFSYIRSKAINISFPYWIEVQSISYTTS